MKTKSRNWIYMFIMMGLLLLITNSCKKDDNINKTPETVSDIDGNIYHTVTIGTQVWLVENLKTTKYNDGTAIPNVTDNTMWITLTTPAYCWYRNDITNKANYGALYNWYTLSTGKLCPIGWHVPNEADWIVLENYLGGASTGGGKLKETGTTYWSAPNIGATNSSGYYGRPSGCRNYINGIFGNNEVYGYWWSSSASIESIGYFILSYDSAACHYQKAYSTSGFSVRCIKD